ncbi:N-acetylmuramoyl-L-alanine amidase [Ornithinibacillus xuwenensis]|uniref:N-acetylmuramoyl-L-alanine amidase n=1 Tax=Ornithinibacillus xuwenensis TaxID=3144668 RepID=A0ABU9XE05_9BACI
MVKYIQDPGHGGSDPGAVANGQKEKEWTLEAGLYVDKRLGELGVYSHMTRSKDVTLEQSARTSKVSKYDKAISHHFNAGGGEGAEFIYSIYADGKFENILIDEFKKAGYPVRRKFQRKYPNKSNWDYYYMHRETGHCRTTIVEYDFLDGGNFSKMKSKSYREGMYECVVKAICREEGVKYIAPGKKEEPKIEKGTFYRVVTGSFQDRANAEQRIAELKKKGFDSFIDVYKK